MVALIIAYYINPLERIIWWSGMGLLGTAAIVVGTRLNRPAHPQYWYILAAANFSFTLGEVMQVIYTQYLQNFSNPAPADGFYLAEYILYALGVFGFIRWRTSERDWASLVDALILSLGLALLIWLYLIIPFEHTPGLTTQAKAVSVAYPLGDLLVIALLVRLLVPQGGKCRALSYLTVGSLGLLVSDILYGLIQLHGTWRIGTPIDLGWTLFYCLWGLAALHPSMVELTRPVPSKPVSISVGLFVLLALTSSIAPALLLINRTGDTYEQAWVICIFSSVLFLLVLARLTIIVSAHRAVLKRERVLRVAGSALTASVTFPQVAETVAAAAATLIHTPATCSALLAVREEDSLRLVGEGEGERGVLLPLPVKNGLPESRLVAVSDLGDDQVKKRLDSVPLALLCPLSLEERALGESLIGALIVGGTERQLAPLWGTFDILAAQSALAVERVMLSREVIQNNSERYFRTLVQSASDVILILNSDDTVRYASSSAERIFGDLHLEGRSIIELVPLTNRESVWRCLADMRAQREPGQPEHWQFLHGDRSLLEVEVRWNNLQEDPTVAGLVLTLRDVTEQRQMERELIHRAFHDALTGLANRVLFQDRIGHALARSERHGTITGVLFIDLDDFKVVNDTQGHAVGDELLVAVAVRISAALRNSDTAARLGGDEFAVLIEDASSPSDVDAAAESLLAAFEEPFHLSSGAVRVGASVGAATTEDSIDAADLLTHADLALYSAKGVGKRQWCRYRPDLQVGLMRRHELGESLDAAIATSAFTVHYQPIVELDTGDLVGFEALARWPDSVGGMLLPDEFIGLAEESGQIVPLGAWVLEQAVAEATRWQRMNGRQQPLRISVNVSARQFRDARFMGIVEKMVTTSGIQPGTLVLELTESVLIRRDERLYADMKRLQELGVKIAIDDFGTGYSSLSYLREFPISVLKIDKSFIDGLDHSHQQYALVKAITSIAHTLGVQVVAEGIENAKQRSLLASMGCPLGQGFLFAKPLTPDQADRYIRQAAASTLQL